jgi:galactokinase
MTGGGFGGSMLALVNAGSGADIAGAVSAEYGRRSGRRPSWLVIPGARR